MTQLPSFLPALFDAFGNQSADVRKVKMIYLCFHFPDIKKSKKQLQELFKSCTQVFAYEIVQYLVFPSKYYYSSKLEACRFHT